MQVFPDRHPDLLLLTKCWATLDKFQPWALVFPPVRCTRGWDPFPMTFGSEPALMYTTKVKILFLSETEQIKIFGSRAASSLIQPPPHPQHPLFGSNNPASSGAQGLPGPLASGQMQPGHICFHSASAGRSAETWPTALRVLRGLEGALGPNYGRHKSP